MNCLKISGALTELEPLRNTPAGVPVLQFQLAHECSVIEAGLSRTVQCDISVIALGDLASMYSTLKLGAHLEVEGFVAPPRKGSPRLRLHAQVIRIVDSDTDINTNS